MQVVGTHTYIDVMWQDGTVTYNQEAREYVPVRAQSLEIPAPPRKRLIVYLQQLRILSLNGTVLKKIYLLV